MTNLANLFGTTITKAKDISISLVGKTKELTQFIRESPILSGAAIGGTVVGGGLIVAQQIRKRKKAKPTRKRVGRRRTVVRRGRQVRRRIIRGRGLGRSEIKHTRKGTKLVSFMANGKRVRFKVRGTSTRRKGFVKKRKRRKR